MSEHLRRLYARLAYEHWAIFGDDPVDTSGVHASRPPSAGATAAITGSPRDEQAQHPPSAPRADTAPLAKAQKPRP
jgi:hypothetical protein